MKLRRARVIPMRIEKGLNPGIPDASPVVVKYTVEYVVVACVAVKVPVTVAM